MKTLQELAEAIGTVIAALAAIALFLAIAVAFGYVLGWFFSVLWNNVVAFLTPLPEISAWQGLGFIVLLNIIGGAFTRKQKA